MVSGIQALFPHPRQRHPLAKRKGEVVGLVDPNCTDILQWQESSCRKAMVIGEGEALARLQLVLMTRRANFIPSLCSTRNSTRAI